MNHVLCIDFGTSSVRAVHRGPDGRSHPLPLGKVTKSKLDDASIRSDVHVDRQSKYVRFGERAVAALVEGSPALFETSPKLWLTEPDRLGERAADSVSLTREQLLTGLLAHAIQAACKAADLGESLLDRAEVRVARPIWPTPVRLAADQALNRMVSKARAIALQREWATVPTAALQRSLEDDSIIHRLQETAVLEPIAAASELLPAEDNWRRLCAVVDVGAGTTDIGLFQSVVPDSFSGAQEKLHRLGEPISVFQAGNAVDDILLHIVESQAQAPAPEGMADVKARIRTIKETLFANGLVHELGVTVRRADLDSHARAKRMASDIRQSLVDLIQRNAPAITILMGAGVHCIQHLDVIMAGGGCSLGFLRSRLGRPINVGGVELPVKLQKVEELRELRTWGASRSRLAVALGGASLHYDHLKHELEPCMTIKRGQL